MLSVPVLCPTVERLEERYEDILREKKELHDKNIGVSSPAHSALNNLHVHVHVDACMFLNER